MQNDRLYIILVFAAAFVVILIVGFIGNKAVDGMSNAFRSKKYNDSGRGRPNEEAPQSLAARFQQAPGGTAQRTLNGTSFCPRCGNPLGSGIRFCPKCGAETGGPRRV